MPIWEWAWLAVRTLREQPGLPAAASTAAARATGASVKLACSVAHGRTALVMVSAGPDWTVFVAPAGCIDANMAGAQPSRRGVQP
mmetsp:Transcript_29532/g.64163  ORF Transcript_29532/g.64163 Transcript_29532/m.64163 type:complete len:85 (-) Transcript_29532:122-376(-)